MKLSRMQAHEGGTNVTIQFLILHSEYAFKKVLSYRLSCKPNIKSGCPPVLDVISWYLARPCNVWRNSFCIWFHTLSYFKFAFCIIWFAALWGAKTCKRSLSKTPSAQLHLSNVPNFENQCSMNSALESWALYTSLGMLIVVWHLGVNFELAVSLPGSCKIHHYWI